MMFIHLKDAIEAHAANLNPMKHVLSVLTEIEGRLADIGETATGEVADQEDKLSERLDSLTNAFAGLGKQFTELTDLLTKAMTRMDQIEAAAKQAPTAAPDVPPAPPAQ